MNHDPEALEIARLARLGLRVEQGPKGILRKREWDGEFGSGADYGYTKGTGTQANYP